MSNIRRFRRLGAVLAALILIILYLSTRSDGPQDLPRPPVDAKQVEVSNNGGQREAVPPPQKAKALPSSTISPTLTVASLVHDQQKNGLGSKGKTTSLNDKKIAAPKPVKPPKPANDKVSKPKEKQSGLDQKGQADDAAVVSPTNKPAPGTSKTNKEPTKAASKIFDDSVPIVQKPRDSIPRHILRIHHTSDQQLLQHEAQNGLDNRDRYNWFKSWDTVNPNHIQILIDDVEESRRLVKGAYGWEVSSTYYKLPYLRQRREYVQFLMLRHFGGVFADMRGSCVKPIDDWDLGLKGIKLIVGVENSVSSKAVRFITHTVASVSRHPFLDKFLTSITVKILKMKDAEMDKESDLIQNLFATHLLDHIRKTSNAGNVTTDLKALSASGHIVYKDILILGSGYFDANSKSALSIFNEDYINRLNNRNEDVKLNDVVGVSDNIGIFRPTAKDTTEFMGFIMPYQILRTWPTKRRVEIEQSSLNATSYLAKNRWAWFQSWEEKNNNHLSIIFDPADQERLVRGTFTKDVSAAYFKVPSDLRPLFARFLMLYEFGGIYADMDTSCQSQFELWLNHKSGVDVLVGVEGNKRINAYTIGAMPGHEFIAGVIRRIVALVSGMSELDLAAEGIHDKVLGNGMFTDVVKEYLETKKSPRPNWSEISSMSSSNKLIDGFLVVGKAHFKPAPYYLLHHLTGFSKSGWRNQKPVFDVKENKPHKDDSGFKKPKVVLPDEHLRNPTGIPNYILRTHVTSDRRSILDSVTAGLDHKNRYEWIQSWDSHNLNHTTILLSDEDAGRFVRGIYGGKVADAYFRLGLVSQRRQMIKYLMIYHFGGVYVDMDVSCESGIDSWISSEKGVQIVVGLEDGKKDVRFVAHTLASVPRHELFDAAIQKIVITVLGKTEDELDSDANLVDNIWNDLLLKHISSTDKNAVDKFKKLKTGHVTIDGVLFLGSSHFQPTQKGSVLSIQHEDVFVRSNAVNSTTLVRYTAEKLTTSLDIYRPKPKNEEKSDGILVPNQVLRTYKTSNRLELQEGSVNKTFDERQWSWFQSWDEVNPNHYQLLWNDEDSDRFVRGTFNEKISEAYFRLPRVVLRADLTRYLMLYALGGVYTDMDTSCHVPIEKWFQGQKGVNVIVGVEHNFGDKDSTNQWTIVSSPRHDFMQLVIQRVVTVILESSVEFLSDKENILDITGPGIFKRVVWDYVRDVKKGNLRDMANLHHGFTLYDDFMVLGRAHMNALPQYVQHHEDFEDPITEST
ncbi:hypothetical protein BCR33DRAFT_854536 [Rhizoclosmatium globosum]|uniref:Alpha 1,4-glycosyltransferase domain-containing protein n=1 Tax=Rhizoclosmatium globosum TaxID=329046 RepID=A0A1Y2BSU4_9FUNG|nr:hypothetical protein BCR33DRAFT_854536 [Rhizoclosmatium globosum]|eukprot:ORY37774.1 hypothetical protein BCR33DRAFT_854536 [Rhizoclosmatium globosum]